MHLQQLPGAKVVAEDSKRRDQHVQVKRPGTRAGIRTVTPAPLTTLTLPTLAALGPVPFAVERLVFERVLENRIASSQGAQREVVVPRVRRDRRDESRGLRPGGG